MKQDPELLHLSSSEGVGWDTLCGLPVGAVEHWCYVRLKHDDPWRHLPVCSTCDDWSNLETLAEAQL